MDPDPASQNRSTESSAGEVCEEWLDVGLSTAPADRPAAERGVEVLYRQLGLDPPARVVWFQSPFAGMLAALLLGAQAGGPGLVSRRVRRLRRRAAWRAGRAPWAPSRTRAAGVLRPVEEQVWEQARTTVAEAVHSDMGPHTKGIWLDYVWKHLGSQGALWPGQASPQAVWDRLWASQRIVSGSMVTTVPGDPPREPTGYGQHDAAWLGRQRLGRSGSDLTADDDLSGLEAIARSSGWWWGFPNVAVLTERATVVRRDAQRRLHADSGPAASYRDNYALWAWHGVAVHRYVIEHPERLSAAAVAAVRDRALRRVMLERCGYGRVVQELEEFSGVPWWRSRARKLDTDPEYGTLWRVRLRREEPLQVVQVTDATPQPDGSRKEYFLRVPSSMRKAKEAVAWTFGKDVGGYGPMIQT